MIWIPGKRQASIGYAPIGIALFLSCLVAASSALSADQSAGSLEKGEKMLAVGAVRQASEFYSKAWKKSGKSCGDCALGYAIALNRMGRQGQAQKLAAKGIEVASDSKLKAKLYNQIGIACLGQSRTKKRLAQAEEAFRKVLALSEGRGNAARYSLGCVLLKEGKTEEGRKVLKEFLSVEPANQLATTVRAVLAHPERALENYCPAFAAKTLVGDAMSSKDLVGKVFLLDFWATWCHPCRDAVPGLRKLAKKMESPEFVMISVSVDEDGDAVKRFVAKNAMTWPQCWDEKGGIRRAFQVNIFPTYVLVDADGFVVYRTSGLTAQTDRLLRKQISKAVTKARKQKSTETEG